MSSSRDSRRDSERDYGQQASTVSDYYDDGEDDDNDPGGIQLTRQLTKGSKAVIDKTWSLIWGDVSAPVNNTHRVMTSVKLPSVSKLNICMHGGLPATHGKVTFTQDVERQKQQQEAQFACMSSQTDPDVVRRLLLNYWQLKPPSVVISVTGSAMDFSLDSGLQQIATEGIARAAKATDAWIFTGGTDTGVMKLVAGALASAKVVTPIIGVTPFHNITDKQRFYDPKRDWDRGFYSRRVHYVKRVQNSASSSALDEQHSHFLLVDDGPSSTWGSEIELRGKVEEKMCDFLRVPRVLLVIQGGRGTFQTVNAMLLSGCHVVIVKESGGCAQVVAEFIEPLLQQTDPKELKGKVAERIKDPECQERLKELITTYNNGVEPSWWRDNAERWLHTIGNNWQLLHVFTMADVHRLPLDMAVLKAVVSSFKMREEKDTEGEQRMLLMKQLSTLSGPLHHNARREDHHSYKRKRTAVSDEQVPWRFDWADYNPTEFTDDVVLTQGVAQGWADPPTPQRVPDLMQRKSYEGGMADFLDKAGVPLNPRGRTGMRGRGLLGKWGPNHAADPIVTRYVGGQLQMVAIKRKDTGVWAIPGGMVDAGETIGDTLRREFAEEAGAHMDQKSKARFEKLTTELFAKGDLVYRGYVDDPRNTDNAWVETAAYHFHCSPELGGMLNLKAGDDAGQVEWLKINPTTEPRYRDLYANHREWVEQVAEKMKPHTKAREETNPQYKGKRVEVADESVPWSKDVPSYHPAEFTDDSVLDQYDNQGVAQGWADPPTPQEVPDLKQRETYEGKIRFDGDLPLNPRGRTGVRGRGLLGKWGPNHAADPIVTRHHPQTGKLQVVAVRREDTGQFAVPGGMSNSPGEKWNVKMWSALQEDLRQEDNVPLEQQHMKALLNDLFQGEESTVVYRGYVDEPRNTDNAWLETTAYHFHCSRELGALLPLKPAPENLTEKEQRLFDHYHSPAGQEVGEEWRKEVKEKLGLNEIFWLDVEEAAGDEKIYASHRDWIEVVRQRLTQMQDHPGLLQLVAQCGRVDLLQDVLKDPELLAQRQPMQVQMAFQGALEHALEPKFDLGLIELLMEQGAKAADVYLPALFALKQDRFGLFDEIYARRLRRWRSRMSITLKGKRSTSVSIAAPSPTRSPSRLNRVAIQESGAASSSRRRWRTGGMLASLASGLASGPTSGEAQKERPAIHRAGTMARVAQAVIPQARRPSNVRALRRKALLGEEEDPSLASSPWRSAHIRFMEKFVKGFNDYAHAQHALHNVDLMFWAITAGAIELAELFWRRCRSPLRAALIAQDMLEKIRLKSSRAGLEEHVALFQRHARGVLEHLPDQETARRLLLSKVGDFATLGSPGKEKESILMLAIHLHNKDFVSHHYCQEILDEMWWGRSENSGRVCLQKPWPSSYQVYAQVFLPFMRILPVVPNDLCEGYPWMSDKDLKQLKDKSNPESKKKVTVKWWRAMLAIWHIPRMKRAVSTVSMVLFTLLFGCVFLDRLCGPLSAERGVLFWLLVVWTLANVVQEVLQIYVDTRAWRRSRLAYEIFTFPLLFAAFGLRWSLTSPRGHTAENLIDFINLHARGRVRPQLHSSARAWEENFRYTWINADADDSGFEGECPWSIELECLRTVLGVVAPMLMLRFTESFTMRKDIGPLMVCTSNMLGNNLRPWLTFVMVTVMLGAALSLSFLAPAYQLEAGDGPFKPFGGLSWGPTELDISWGGPVWASFWGLFGFYEPGEISSSSGASYLAVLAMAFYMMLVAVVFINLLIAMFNQTYDQTIDNAEEEWKMKRVDKVYSFMRLYPVPAPLNLITLVYDLVKDSLTGVVRALCLTKKPKRIKPQSSSRRDAATSEGRPSAASRSSSGRSCSFAADHTDASGSSLKPKGSEAEPTSRLQSALVRRSTRVQLLMRDKDEAEKAALALFSQAEAETAEDKSRHAYLKWLEHNNNDVTAMAKKEDQILAAVKRIFRDGGKVREKVQMLCDKVEKLELRSLEDRQKGEERNLMQRNALTKTLTIPGNLQRHLSGSARAEPSSASTDLRPLPHRPAPGLAAPAPAPLAQPAHAPAAQHAAPGASQSAGAPSTACGQWEKVEKKVEKKAANVSANVFSVVKPLPPVPRPALRPPVLPP